MQERQNILESTIGYLEKEEEALSNGYLILILSVILVFAGSILQIVFFYLYNGEFHPFANILKGNESGKNCK